MYLYFEGSLSLSGMSGSVLCPMGWTWLHSAYSYAEFGDISSYMFSMLNGNLLDHVHDFHVVLILMVTFLVHLNIIEKHIEIVIIELCCLTWVIIKHLFRLYFCTCSYLLKRLCHRCLDMFLVISKEH